MISKKPLSSILEMKVNRLQDLLVQNGYITEEALHQVVALYESQIGPRNGAQVVARAWMDAEYKKRLLANASEAVAELGFMGRQGEHLVAIENTAEIHNVVVCTLCSCYPWTVLGLPPVWYKSLAYRSRAVLEPRKLLEEFNLYIPDQQLIRVWDSTSEVRYMVIPMRPLGTENWTLAELAKIVTRDSMIGVGLVKLD